MIVQTTLTLTDEKQLRPLRLHQPATERECNKKSINIDLFSILSEKIGGL